MRDELKEACRTLVPLYMLMAGPVLFVALFGLFFMDGPKEDDSADRIRELEQDARYLEMELDFVRNLHGI